MVSRGVARDLVPRYFPGSVGKLEIGLFPEISLRALFLFVISDLFDSLMNRFPGEFTFSSDINNILLCYLHSDKDLLVLL